MFYRHISNKSILLAKNREKSNKKYITSLKFKVLVHFVSADENLYIVEFLTNDYFSFKVRQFVKLIEWKIVNTALMVAVFNGSKQKILFELLELYEIVIQYMILPVSG